MKEIKIAILDFWPNDGHFQLCNNVFINTITDVYYVKIDKENPDIIFYSLFGIEHRKEQYKHVPKVLFNGESYGSDFGNPDYVIDMERSAYELSIEQFCTSAEKEKHCYMPLWLYDRDFPILYDKSRSILMEEKHLNNDNLLHTKSGFCSFVASTEVLFRDNFCGFVSKNYKTVDCPGKVLHNTSIELSKGFIAKHNFLKDRKFNLCFENRIKAGYCTEKIVDAFAAHTIPIYLGDPYVENVFNKDSFINAGKCNKFSEVLEQIQEIDNNDELYMKMINTPALVDPTYPEKILEKMKDFILNIVYNL